MSKCNIWKIAFLGFFPIIAQSRDRKCGFLYDFREGSSRWTQRYITVYLRDPLPNKNVRGGGIRPPPLLRSRDQNWPVRASVNQVLIISAREEAIQTKIHQHSPGTTAVGSTGHTNYSKSKWPPYWILQQMFINCHRIEHWGQISTSYNWHH